MDRKKKKKQSESTNKANRVTYSETVRINIADYEHRDIFVSTSVEVEPGETLDDAYKRANLFVRRKLFAREKKLRTQSQEFVDFDTKAKLP